MKKNAQKQNPEAETRQAGPDKDTNTRQVQHELMEFIGYNDDGDYFLLIAKKGGKVFSFINDQSNDRTLLRGDIINVSRETDTIDIAGDENARQPAEKIVSVVKVSNGNVSKFRLRYRKPLKYTWPEAENYSASYLDKLYTLVEYYIANSNNKLLQIHIKNGDQLTYSIEQQTRDAKEYLLIGIAATSEHHVNTIQWLYLDTAENILYEYDLAADSLVRFD